MMANATKQISVLIAEDDKFLGNVLRGKLEQEGFAVILAIDGEQTLKSINESVPDLLLLDIIMPKKNGFDVLQQLRLADETKNLPVLILSNLGQEEDITRAKALGAVDFLVKSDHSLQEIVDKVKQHAARVKVRS